MDKGKSWERMMMDNVRSWERMMMDKGKSWERMMMDKSRSYVYKDGGMMNKKNWRSGALWVGVKPPTDYYHYSNPESQNALIACTSDFPDELNRNTHDLHSAYSDRLYSWDHDRFHRVCEIAGCGSLMWGHKATIFDDARLKAMAKEAFDLTEEPEHARLIHAFNVATGYSCPVLQAISRRE